VATFESVKKRLEALANALRFDSTEDGQVVHDIATKCLGRDLAAHASVEITSRTLGAQEQADGSPLAANRGKYGQRKAKIGLPVGVGIKGKRSKGRPMISLVEVQGKVEIGDEGKTLTMRFGTSEDVRKKGEWFTNGSTKGIGESSGAKGQPPRPFYQLDAALKAELVAMIENHVREVIRRANGG
jgi:hypothetical protein